MPNPKKLRARCMNNCERRVRTSYAKFCSASCSAQYKERIVLEAFFAETYVPLRQLSRRIRRYLIATLGEQCQRCGWATRHPQTGRVPLEIEHIDGDWRNAKPSNLTVLCPSCHSLTPTFKALNRGRGRPGRPGLRPRTADASLEFKSSLSQQS